MTVLTEENIVRRILSKFNGTTGSNRIVIPNGDDAAAVRLRPENLMVITSDMLVEHVHFTQKTHSWEDIGYKAMAVNISDLSAMGAVTPKYAVVSAGITRNITVNNVDKLYTGMWKLCREYGIRIIGGDTVRSSKDIVLSITLLGEGKRANGSEKWRSCW